MGKKRHADTATARYMRPVRLANQGVLKDSACARLVSGYKMLQLPGLLSRGHLPQLREMSRMRLKVLLPPNAFRPTLLKVENEALLTKHFAGW